MLFRSQSVLDGLRGAVGIEDLGRGPALGVGDVGVRAVSCVAVLVDEVPELLGSEVDLSNVSLNSSHFFLCVYGLG